MIALDLSEAILTSLAACEGIAKFHHTLLVYIYIYIYYVSMLHARNQDTNQTRILYNGRLRGCWKKSPFGKMGPLDGTAWPQYYCDARRLSEEAIIRPHDAERKPFIVVEFPHRKINIWFFVTHSRERGG